MTISTRSPLHADQPLAGKGRGIGGALSGVAGTLQRPRK
jgi:hypothetical protein